MDAQHIIAFVCLGLLIAFEGYIITTIVRNSRNQQAQSGRKESDS